MREYIQSQLSSTLDNGQCYKVSFYANLLNGSKFATNNLGLYFSPNPIISNNSVLNFTPNISTLNLVRDTLNWIEVTGVFEANGNENYLIIGNFRNDTQTDTLVVSTNTISNAAYYLIDDVSVINISDLGGMPAYAGEDRGMVFGDSTFIGQEISNLNCTWTDLDGNLIANNTSGLFVHPSQTTSYAVEQTLCGVTTFDTVTVYVHGLGVSSLEGKKAIIAPNPSNGKFSISSSNISSVQFIDQASRKVNFISRQVGPEIIEIDCDCESGLYYLMYEDGLGLHSAKVKIIKE